MIDQLGIAIFGLTAVFLTQTRSDRWMRWAPIVGLISQPFWFWSSWHANQWGIFACAIVYTACWLMGIYNFWVRR